MNIKHYLQPWVLITIGILMNIISAIVTHYFISQNNAKLNIIEQKISTIENNIENKWQSKNEMERKKEFILLLFNSEEKHAIKPAIKNYLNHYLATLKQHYLTQKELPSPKENSVNIETTINITQLAQEHIINSINDQYFEKLELESAQQPYKDNNAMLYSIAIFMQLIGLILVLSRDLTRQ